MNETSTLGRRKKDFRTKVTAQLRKTLVKRSVSMPSLTPTASFSLPPSPFPDLIQDPVVSHPLLPPTAEKMAQQRLVDDCLNWITEQQKSLDRINFEVNKKVVEDAVADLKKRTRTVLDYRSTVDKIRSTIQDQAERDRLDLAYSELVVSFQTRLRCMENSSQILGLEELFTPVCMSVTSTASTLVQDINKENGPTPDDGINIAALSQDCILANRKTWEHLKNQLKCTETHLKNAADYQQFFYDAKNYQPWMTSDLRRARDLMKQIQLKGKKLQPGDAEKILSQLKTALAILLNWKSKLESLTDRSRKVLPVQLRLQKLDFERPALCLSDYQTNDTKIQEGEEVSVIDNSNKQLWKVRNALGEVIHVPSNQLVILGTEPAAVEAASKLRLAFLSDFSNMVKDCGKAVLSFLTRLIKDWSPEEEQMLKSLSPPKKQQIQQLLNSVIQLFSPIWDAFPPFQKLRPKMDKLKQILNDRSQQPHRPMDSNAMTENVIVSDTDNVDDVISNFKEWWQNWEQFTMLTESSRHPEYLLVVNSPDQYKFLSPAEMKKKWQQCLLEFDETDFDCLEDDEVYTIETAKETAETSHLTTCEQEERQTFIITGVIDPRSDEQISLDRAVTLGIINQREGKYVNPTSGESIPIPTAMNAGKIKVEFTRTNKSVEKRSDVGLITIKTYREARPFTVKAVVDAKTEKQLTVDDAIRAGIMDQKRGIYINMNTKEELPLADALDSGLLVVEFDNENDDAKTNGSGEPEYISKTYAIHAVIDTKSMSRKTFAEAVASGLIDPETGAYCNKSTGEHVYVGDAIKKGLIKATVVLDSKTLDIAPANRMTIPDAKMETFRQTKPSVPASNGVRSHLQTNGVTNGVTIVLTNGSRY